MGYSPGAFGSMTTDQPSGYSAARAEARPANTSAVQACCTCKVLLDKQFEVPANALRQKNNPKSSQAGTLKTSRDDKWGAEILIDGTAKVIYVTTRLTGENNTTDLTRAGTKPISDAALADNEAKIVTAIRQAWNARPYKLEIKDNKCEALYRVEFNPIFVPSGAHYKISFLNEPFTPNGRSAVNISGGTAMFNLGDERSVIGWDRPGALESHEYGHMLGLLDEYFEFEDLNNDGDGLDLIEYQKGTTTRTGRVLQNAAGQSYTKSQYDPARFDYRWEKDLGGMRYTWPAVTGLPVEDSPDNKGLMGGMRETTARRQPYIATVAYAVIEVLRVNGRTVTSMTVHS